MISLILLFFAGAARGLAELLAFNHGKSIFSTRKSDSFFGSDSWSKKYKREKIGSTWHYLSPPDNWYYRNFDLHAKEKFFLSATALVFFTDGFHLCNFLMRWLIVLSIVTFTPFTEWYWLILFYSGAWHAGFVLTYNILFQKR